MDFSKLKPMPDRVILRITAEERASIFNKSYVRPDGTMYSLILTVDEAKGFDRKATLYAKTAEVVAVGRKVKNIEVGDIALLDYKVDNDENVVLGWENGDKYVSVRGVSTYYESDIWAYATRQQKQDIRAAKKGALKDASDILGCIRGDKLIANDPYVFVEHRANGNIKTASGIEYTDDSRIAETRVLAASFDSTKRFGIENGQNSFVKFDDLFDVELPDGKICACNDEDVLLHL
jgi:co-chaperonin GroES (HSP10)